MPDGTKGIPDNLNAPMECGLEEAFAAVKNPHRIHPAQRNADAWAAKEDRLKIEALRKANEEGVLDQVLRGEK